MRKSMSTALGHRPRAGELIGYWRDGRPIYLPGGGSVDAGTDPLGTPPPPGGIPVTVPPPAPTPPRALTAEDLAQERARWQAEADQRLAAREAELQQGFDARLRPFEEERAQREADAQAAAEAAAEAERQRLAAEETAAQRIERIQQETNERLANYEAQIAQRDELMRREQERSALIQYRAEQLTAHSNDIHPAMHEMVVGFTREEIDASVVRAQQATAKMVDEFAQMQQGAAAQIAGLQRAVPGASVTQPPAGPMEAVAATRTLSNDELANLSPAEYERLRPQLMRTASDAYHGRGGFAPQQ